MDIMIEKIKDQITYLNTCVSEIESKQDSIESKKDSLNIEMLQLQKTKRERLDRIQYWQSELERRLVEPQEIPK